MISVLRPEVDALELLLRKLGAGTLRADGVAAFGRLDDPRTWAAGSEVSTAGAAQLVGAGYVAEVRDLRDGRRQITALRLPGDLFGPQISPPTVRAVALTRAQTVDAGGVLAALRDPSDRFEPLRRAWAAARGLEEIRAADHLVRLGRLSAYERAAHFLLEVHARLRAVGLARPDSFHMPLTQEMLSDVLGLSIVHVNRTMQQLRRDGLIAYRSGQITFREPTRLASLPGFSSGAAPDPVRGRSELISA